MRRWFASALLGVGALCALFLNPAWGQAAASAVPVGPDGLLTVPPLARVVDQPGQLSAAERATLDQRLQRFESEHGAQVAIVIVASTLTEPIEDFANRVGATWKIGRHGVGDGMLIVVATQDRHARIEVARALEGAIPDAIAKRVIQQTMGPHFKQGDYAGGLSAALDVLLPRIEQEQLGGPMPPAPGGPPHASAPSLHNLLPLLFGAVFIGMAMRRALGAGGALVAGAGAGALASLVVGSILLGALAGLAVFVISLLLGAGYGRSIGGPGGIGFPGSFGGGGGGGFSSGGGGDFSGGGASGDW